MCGGISRISGDQQMRIYGFRSRNDRDVQICNAIVIIHFAVTPPSSELDRMHSFAESSTCLVAPDRDKYSMIAIRTTWPCDVHARCVPPKNRHRAYRQYSTAASMYSRGR